MSAHELQLLPNDKIFVYENINYRNSFTYRIEGEVNKPGTYPFIEGTTIEDAIEKAGGLNNFIIIKKYCCISRIY